MTDPEDNGADLIRDYLQAVSDVLQEQGLSAADIESVCDGLHAQISDLSNQLGPATSESVRLAIDSMDPPASFADLIDELPHASRTISTPDEGLDARSPVASLGFYVAISGPIVAIIAGIVASVLGHSGWEFGSFVLVAAALIAMTFGAVSFELPRGRTAILVALSTLLGYAALFVIGIVLE